MITIADAEADIFDLLNQPRRENSELLIRGTHNRSIQGTRGKNLHQSISEVKPSGILEVEVKRNPKHEARQAKLTLRFATLEFAVPRHHPRQQELKPIRCPWAHRLHEHGRNWHPDTGSLC